MSAPAPVYVVSTSSGVEQVFADPGDAAAFARQRSDARVSRYHVAPSMEDGVVIFDRKVVVADGAPVEYFLDPDSRWHIFGFGIDREALDARVQSVIDEVSAPDRAGALEVVGGRGRW